MVSVTAVSRVLELDGRKQTVSGSEVVCADTVLFPEGGGQNTDRGTISDVPVLSVSRRGTEAVHLVSPPVSWSPGTVVRQRLDWGRRWDNMQQHSGQHLVSAVLEREHNTKVSLGPGFWVLFCFLRRCTNHWSGPDSLLVDG